MLNLGEKQILTIVKRTDFGVYLAEKGGEETVLLPKKEVPEQAQIGDEAEVFLYRDSKDRIIATARTPLLMIGTPAVLKVKEISRVGAFLDWGLEKDLLLPFREQTKKVKAGDECLAALYMDKSGRLCATMNVYEQLKKDSPYKKDDHVTGRIYQTSREFGLFVAVDDCYSALIPQREAVGNYQIGDIIEARVTAVKPDGKLDLSVREKAYLQMGADAEKVMSVIEKYKGELPFNDKADPETIRREFSLSKSAFKRAVGRLLKEGRIEITENSIRKITGSTD